MPRNKQALIFGIAPIVRNGDRLPSERWPPSLGIGGRNRSE
jgi:hypothetical protein